MELCSDKFVSETTFSKYYSFGAGGDFINPKVCQKRSKLLFHLPTLIERWKSIVKENLSLSTRFWDHYLKIVNFRLTMVTSFTQKMCQEGPNWYFMYQC